MERISKKRLSVLGLILVAILWGYGFVAVDIAMDHGMDPTLILALRFLIASLFIVIVFFKRIKTISKREFLLGSISGVFLFAGFYMQTVGQKMSTASKSAFLSSMNVILVPFVVWILQKKKPKNKVFYLSIFTLLGAAIISFDDPSNLTLHIGDVLLILGAVFFACQLSFLGVFGRTEVDAVRVTFIQMITAGIISTLVFLVFKLDTIKEVNFKAATPAILYIGIVSTSICYLIHMASQKYVLPTQTSLILSTESIFAAIFSIAFGHDKLTFPLVLGGIFIFASIILSSIDLKEIVTKIRRK